MMFTYEVLSYEDGRQCLIKTDAQGKSIFIRMQEDNKHYAEYLRYTAWVEAGNTPEDFWTQSEVDY